MLFKAFVGVPGVVGHDTVHLDLTKLDDSLVQVSKVLEKVVVIGIDKLLPLEF